MIAGAGLVRLAIRKGRLAVSARTDRYQTGV